MSAFRVLLFIVAPIFLCTLTASGQSIEDLRAQQLAARDRLNDYAKKATDLELALKDPDLPDNAEAEQRLHNEKLEDQRVKLTEERTRLRNELRDLTQDIRDKGIKLSIDGMGLSGRISTKELELTDLLKRQAQARRDFTSARLEFGKAVAATQSTNSKADLSRLEKLRERKEALDQELRGLTDEINQAKADVGDMTYALNNYLAQKDEEQYDRRKLREVEEKLRQVSAAQLSRLNPATNHNKEALKSQLTRINGMQDHLRSQLKDLDAQVEKLHQSQAAALFPGPCDIYLSPAELAANKPAITSAHFSQSLEINNKRFVRLTSDTNTWTLDPTQILAIRSSK